MTDPSRILIFADQLPFDMQKPLRHPVLERWGSIVSMRSKKDMEGRDVLWVTVRWNDGGRNITKPIGWFLRYHRTTDTLPADPEGLNDQRADWAEDVLAQFAMATFGEPMQDESDWEAALADLLCDLMHYCDRNGPDFDDALIAARHNYQEETDPNGLAAPTD
jgi:hypothetical protein